MKRLPAAALHPDSLHTLLLVDSLIEVRQLVFAYNYNHFLVMFVDCAPGAAVDAYLVHAADDNKHCYSEATGAQVRAERTSHFTTRHTPHITRHTSHTTRHTSHVTHHTSHVTHHTSGRHRMKRRRSARRCRGAHWQSPPARDQRVTAARSLLQQHHA